MDIASKNNDLCDYDAAMVQKFNEGILFKNGKYFIRLPWIKGKVNLVPFSFNVAYSVLQKVLSLLQNQNAYEEYNNGLQKQLSEGILEQIKVPESDRHNYVFVPHRPVIKREAQVTKKVRAVLNCSLKTSKSLTSLSEASYSGID